MDSGTTLLTFTPEIINPYLAAIPGYTYSVRWRVRSP